MEEHENGANDEDHFAHQVALVRLPHVHHIEVHEEPVQELDRGGGRMKYKCCVISVAKGMCNNSHPIVMQIGNFDTEAGDVEVRHFDAVSVSILLRQHSRETVWNTTHECGVAFCCIRTNA